MLIHLVAGLLLSQGLPTTLAQEEPARQKQEEDRSNEFSINVNLWPVLESTTLPDGNRRTSLWPLFHVTTMPKGGVHSWHVLNFLTGPNYHMFLPLYYSIDEHVGILPPLVLSGPDYFLTPPLLTGQWRHADGDQSTWVTPLFHVTKTPDGDVRSLHAGPYFQGEDYWGIPPLLTWQRTFESGEKATWVTPLFHRTSDQKGDLVSTHFGPYFHGRNYWMLFPLAGSKTHEDESTSTWVTPLFHLTRSKTGEVEDYHVGPLFLTGKDWWTIPPLLMWGQTTATGSEMSMALIFGLRTDEVGVASTSLCPVFWWERERSLFVLPLLSGWWDGGKTTLITPLFHLSQDEKGNAESFHVGPYFEGKDYWAVPPLISWHTRDENGGDSTWLTPLFHVNHDKEGATSSHLFPVYFWERDDYWVAPPLLSMGWRSGNGDRTTWATPFFHWTADEDGLLINMHLGPYMQGRDFWGIPPLLTGGWRHQGGGNTTWVTPLFHSTTNVEGDLESLHVGPFFQGRNYWAIPPLMAWHVAWPDESETTWLTPAFHLSVDPKGEVSSAHLLPAFFYDRQDYWVVPPLLSGSWSLGDGSRTTWMTPMLHYSEEANGDLRSLHVMPLWCWERDRYWAIPPLFTGGGTHADGAETTWITPLFHFTETRTGDLESFHTFPVFFWKRDDYWIAPFLLSGGFTRPDGSYRTWISPLYHDDYAADGSLLSRHALNYFEGANYHHVVPVFWDWKDQKDVRHTLFTPPVYVRTAEPDGAVTSSLPWPIVSWRTGPALDTSLGMEIRPFLYQEAGEQVEFNFLWRMFSVLREEDSTRVMVGPLWYSERPNVPDAWTSFQILGGFFARDCNYDTRRYRYRLLWFIPLGSSDMR